MHHTTLYLNCAEQVIFSYLAMIEDLTLTLRNLFLCHILHGMKDIIHLFNIDQKRLFMNYMKFCSCQVLFMLIPMKLAQHFKRVGTRGKQYEWNDVIFKYCLI